MNRKISQLGLSSVLALCALLLVFAWPQAAKAVDVGTYGELIAALRDDNAGDIQVTADITEANAVADQVFSTQSGFKTAAFVGGKNRTLDLGGHTVALHFPKGNFGIFLTIREGADLSIRNGTLTLTTGDKGSLYGIWNYGTLQLDGLTLEAPSGAFSNQKGATATINTGNLTSLQHYAVGNWGTLNITDGNFISLSYAAVSNEGTLSIAGGTFIGRWCGLHHLHASDSSVTLSGGTFTRKDPGNTADPSPIKVSNGTIRDCLAPGKGLKLDGTLYPLADEAYLDGDQGEIVDLHPLTLSSYLELVPPLSGDHFPEGTPIEVQKKATLPGNSVISKVTVNGTELTESGGVYAFTMPAEAAHVDATLDTGSGNGSPVQGFLISVFTIDMKQFQVEKNGAKVTETMDVAPYIKMNRTMLPLRFVAQSLNMQVDFDNVSRNVTVSDGTRSLVCNLDSDVATIDGRSYRLESKPEVIAGRTMLPIGEIADLLGLSREAAPSPKGNLYWDGAARTVTIKMPLP